jgi:hypothetical protein
MSSAMLPHAVHLLIRSWLALVSAMGTTTTSLRSFRRWTRDPNFLGLANSWKLFYFITSNWEQISEHEKERLREVLGTAFDNCGDWMGAFVIGEILGEHYPDEVTLAILARLAKTANLLNVQLLPHALEHLAKATDRESLRSQAIQQLQELGKSDSVEVRDEAFTSLAKLGI